MEAGVRISRFNFNALIFKDIYVIFATKIKIFKGVLSVWWGWGGESDKVLEEKQRSDKYMEYPGPPSAGDNQHQEERGCVFLFILSAVSHT